MSHYFTINEFSNVVDNGHGTGLTAPGLTLPQAEVNQVRHHVVLAHGLAVQALRAHAPAGTKVGPADNTVITAPVVATPENVSASARAMRELNAGYLTVMLEGRYTEAYLEATGADAPSFTDEELATIGSDLDFVGINIYMVGSYVEATDDEAGYRILPSSSTHPRAARWQLISPEAMYWGPRQLQAVWDVDEIYVTEHGCHSGGAEGDGGHLVDTDRITFLRSYLTQLQRATEDGVPVRGYFHWSIMDNFEWMAAYANRYGLYHVDFETQQRTPKLSASYYRELIARNAVV